jgi:hypothetical protein
LPWIQIRNGQGGRGKMNTGLRPLHTNPNICNWMSASRAEISGCANMYLTRRLWNRPTPVTVKKFGRYGTGNFDPYP